MKNISFHEIQEEDVAFLNDLMNNESILRSLNEVPTTPDIWKSAISEWNDDDDEEDYLILENEHPVGWFGINNLSSDNRQVFLKIIAILPDKQGFGIGPYVIIDLLIDLKSRGYESIALYTDYNNINAQKCYQKCGFTISETVTQKMSNGQHIKRYKMGRSLS